MPKRVYFDTVKKIEKVVGYSFINKAEMEKTLCDAWKNDQSEAKNDFIETYKNIFKDVLKKWTATEIVSSINSSTIAFS